MASSQRNSPDGDEHMSSQSNDAVQPSMTIHPVSYSSMPMHMYPFPPGMVPASQPLRSKRRQVKNACTNCQKACKKCDDARPCLRCVKYGVSEECIDSQRKERKKGIKRGPYKKRDSKGNTTQEQAEVSVQPQPAPINGAAPPSASSPPMGQFMSPIPFPPGYYPQFPPQGAPKPGEGGAPAYFPGYYIPVPAPPPPNGQEGRDAQGGYPQGYYPYPPYAQYPPPYMMPHPGQDGQMMIPNPHYAAYPHMFPPGQKPPSSGGSVEQGGSGNKQPGEGNQDADK